MAALAIAEERGSEFLTALRKRASKKPMPSAMKGNRAKKAAANRKRITFVDSDAEDDDGAAHNDQEAADVAEGGSDVDSEDAVPMHDAKAKAKPARNNSVTPQACPFGNSP